MFVLAHARDPRPSHARVREPARGEGAFRGRRAVKGAQDGARACLSDDLTYISTVEMYVKSSKAQLA